MLSYKALAESFGLYVASPCSLVGKALPSAFQSFCTLSLLLLFLQRIRPVHVSKVDFKAKMAILASVNYCQDALT